MVVDGVVVSKVNFSNQHLRLLQAPSSLMKYKNETNVGPIYLSIIDILSYLWNISLGYGKSLEEMNQQQSSEDPLTNFSNQHLRLLRAPSSLMKYKNETHVGPYISVS